MESPELIKSGEVGRPKYLIHEEVLLQLRSSGFTWSKIADMLLVSRWTLQRRVVEFNLQEVTGFSELSDDELDVIVARFMRNHGTLRGILWYAAIYVLLGLECSVIESEKALLVLIQ